MILEYRGDVELSNINCNLNDNTNLAIVFELEYNISYINDIYISYIYYSSLDFWYVK